MPYYHDLEELVTLCISRISQHLANHSSEDIQSPLQNTLFPLWISTELTVTVNLFRRDMRITEPKCLQRKHKHSSAKLTHSVRDKGAGIFLRKRLINLCFLSVSLSEMQSFPLLPQYLPFYFFFLFIYLFSFKERKVWEM